MRLCETHQPAAEHWRFVPAFEFGREAVDGKVGCSAVAFFSGPVGGHMESICGDLQGPPSTLQDAASAVRRVKIKGFPREKWEPEVAEERDGYGETSIDWEFPDHG